MEPEPAATFKPGTLEHSLLHSKLTQPPERVRRGNAHHAPKPLERWHSALNDVVRTFIHDSQFPYSKIGRGEIRLLCIHPGSGTQPLKGSLFKRKLTEAFNGYEALSYCWGNPKIKNTHEILIRDLNATLPKLEGERRKTSPGGIFRMAVKATFEIPFSIRQNLYQALIKLRSKKDAVNVWVDAICIDQSERGKSEKQEQLSQMAEIYNSASNVCIWIGDASEGSSDGIQLVRDIMNFKTFDVLVNTPNAKQRWSHLIDIMNAPWFSRHWIIQEVALARNASIHCAEDVFHWDDFAEAVSLLEKIDILRDKFRDEIFEDVESNSACTLVHTLSNVCRKSDDGEILAKLSDLETLVSTLLGFQATFPRDTIYSILSLARDPPQPNESWEALHSDQLKRNQRNAELLKVNKSGPKAQSVGPIQTRSVSLTANYKLSTRDLFIAFVTRCIERSGCLDIICRHWAPPVKDKLFSEEVRMPSWISGMSKAPYDLPGTSQGRQNGENFVAYSPYDLRKRYGASGSYKARIRMIEDPSLDPPEIDQRSSRQQNIQIMNGPLTQSPMPSPTAERFAHELGTIIEDSEDPPGERAVGTKPKTVGTAAGLKVESSALPNHQINMSNNPITGTPAIHVTAHTSPSQSQDSSSDHTSEIPPAAAVRSSADHFRIPLRKTTKAPDVELEHEISGILAVQGFVVGTITDHSDVMRGGIIPGDWVYKMRWEKEQRENRVPDTLWRLLVADRTQSGGKPPQWYKRACLHGLVDPRVADAEGNLHSVTPADRKISEMTTKYFNRVANVVWNRRLFEAQATEGFRGPLFGLTPKESEVGYIVCILLGCTVPVVLRKVEKPLVPNQYELVGEAYVHGMMDGEAVENEKLVTKLLQ